MRLPPLTVPLTVTRTNQVCGVPGALRLAGTELDKSTIIHQWLGGSTAMPNLTSHGYRGLWSTDGVWYLDGLATTWQTMYMQEPCKGVAAENEHLVMGGGGEQW